MDRQFKILGSSIYLPSRRVDSEEVDKLCGKPNGWIEKKSGMKSRYYIGEKESAPQMAAECIKQVLDQTGLCLKEIDLVLGASGTACQAIPCNASLFLEALGGNDIGVPAYDVNSTCLSFVAALNVATSLLASGVHKRILIVSSDVASIGLNYDEWESAALLGDGASAIIIEKADNASNGSKVICSRFETYPSGAHDAEIRSGGSLKHPIRGKNVKETDSFFNMHGRKIFKMAKKTVPLFFENLLLDSNLKIDEFDHIIPHQASPAALSLMQKQLGIDSSKYYNVVSEYGNMIAVSIAMGLHCLISSGNIQKGDKVLLIGTSAGFSIGALGFVY